MLLKLVMISSAVAVVPTSTRRQPPHILFIVADDLGQFRPFTGKDTTASPEPLVFVFNFVGVVVVVIHVLILIRRQSIQ